MCDGWWCPPLGHRRTVLDLAPRLITLLHATMRPDLLCFPFLRGSGGCAVPAKRVIYLLLVSCDSQKATDVIDK